MKKKCSFCLKTKMFSEFQIRKSSQDGLTASCKECLHKRDALRYPKEKKRRMEWQSRYLKTKKGRRISNAAKKKWREKNLVKRAAHIIVGNAIKAGMLVKSKCEKCGAKKTHAHHDDYSKPLNVKWLCAKHHVEHHRDIS